MEPTMVADPTYTEWWKAYRLEQYDKVGQNALTYFKTLFEREQKYLLQADRDLFPDVHTVKLHPQSQL